jgi:signal transduction histidine kinase
MNTQEARVERDKTNEPNAADEALSLAIKRMRQSGALPTDAVAIIAHEMRNPLNAMLGFTEMLRSETYGPHADPRYREYSEIVHTAANKLLRICTRLLDDATVAELPRPVEKGTISAARVIAGTVELYSAMARERGVELTMSVDGEFPMLRIDEEALEGVLGNLVSNAIKFTPAGGQVSVKATVSAENGAAILVVSDTGIGMTPEMITELMRSMPIPNRVGPHGDSGTGLGLALVQSRLAKLGIHLEFSSAVSVGTVMTITFPKTVTEPMAK